MGIHVRASVAWVPAPTDEEGDLGLRDPAGTGWVVRGVGAATACAQRIFGRTLGGFVPRLGAVGARGGVGSAVLLAVSIALAPPAAERFRRDCTDGEG